MDNPQPREIVVQVDDTFTLGDLAKMSDPKTPAHELIGLLDRCVVGGALHLPVSRLRAVAEAVGKAIADAANPVDAEKKV